MRLQSLSVSIHALKPPNRGACYLVTKWGITNPLWLEAQQDKLGCNGKDCSDCHLGNTPRRSFEICILV